MKIVTKTITKTEQIVMATSATNATGDLIWSDELPMPISEPPSISAASPLYKFPSSASCDNCFSAAIRRFPAGEELMQSPEERTRKKKQIVIAVSERDENEMNVSSCKNLISNFFLPIHLFLSILIYPRSLSFSFPHSYFFVSNLNGCLCALCSFIRGHFSVMLHGNDRSWYT